MPTGTSVPHSLDESNECGTLVPVGIITMSTGGIQSVSSNECGTLVPVGIITMPTRGIRSSVRQKDYRDIYGGDSVHDFGKGVNYTWRANEYKRTGRANCFEYWQGEEGNTAGQTTSSSRRPSILGDAAAIKSLFSSSFKATSTNNNYNFPLASAISLSLFLSLLIFRRWRRVKDSGISAVKSSWVPFSTMSKSTMKTSGSGPQLQQ
ncbi:Uncharacterized protein Fot_50577 [Forsythia ovata]|uniref:Uncharacterized protein n=1 Tax=Forsythia ovata TaxID=205694 RepID=A0ABD1Q2K7_9LAMI